jgi:cellulose synthase/poly-beta-1,6-N-acetylglucosamine synthase-like glycosyltransferase
LGDLAVSLVAFAYVTASLVLAAHAVVQVRLLLAARSAHVRRPMIGRVTASSPVVTVQLPVFNERFVVERLLDLVAALRYPREALEVQVLDDSTDDTSDLIVAWILRAGNGLRVQHLRRHERVGYKAGALAKGLERASGELVAVFDADFLPPPDFLERTVPWFADDRVAFVQGRWGHTNRNASWLTEAMALLLDVHFHIEQAGRSAIGCFVNFNGTAGIWRTEAVRAAGGWSAATLTEDLDLSYRAQLLGWRGVYDSTLVVPAELPSDPQGMRPQQYRWMKGLAENARRLLPSVLRSGLPWRIQLHAVAHLLESSMFLALAVVVVMAAPLGLLAVSGTVHWLIIANPVLAASFVVLVPVYREAYRKEVARSVPGFLRTYLGLLVLSFGLAVHNATAALAGFAGHRSAFERTPKRGDCSDEARWRASGYRTRTGPVALVEIAVWIVSIAIVISSARAGTIHLVWPVAASALSQTTLLLTGLVAWARRGRSPHGGRLPTVPAG